MDHPMNPHLRRLAAAIASLLFILGGLAAFAAPNLTLFGYRNMTTQREIPLAVILVNFTNATVDAKKTVPYRMGEELVGGNYAAAEQYYSNWFFGRPEWSVSVNNYFHEISNGRFRWNPAGVHMVTVDTNDLYEAFFLRSANGDAADTAYITKMVKQAIAQGFDLASYGAAFIDELDCTIILYTNDKTFGGGARHAGINLGGGSGFYQGKVAIQQYTMGLRVAAEELIHVLQAGVCGDIYGPSSMSHGFSTMSADDGAILHVDPWHKLQLGWSEPRIRSLWEGGLINLPAAQLMDSNGPVILYDPSQTNRDTREFFMLEYRCDNVHGVGKGYDANVADNGLVIWHIQQNQRTCDPVNYTSTYFPFSEQHWFRCSECFGLFYTQGNQHCPATAGNHKAVDGHLRMPYDNPAVQGVPGWRYCRQCGQLFYLPNINASVCAAGGLHSSGTGAYNLRLDSDPESLGQRGWRHCGKCQTLFHDIEGAFGVCAAGGPHETAAGTSTYAVMWEGGDRCMMIEGSPNLSRSQGGAWHGGDLVPTLRWFDGTLSRTRIKVYPFDPGDDTLTIEIMPHGDTWVDFGYRGLENGSFEQPFNTLLEGANTNYPGGTLHLKTGVSPEILKIKKPMRIEAYGGVATVGRP